ncbi:MAG: two-component system, OmpR family, alkaline phosphatase synthesis response regulator PhoP [Moorella sp. (in: firmicutes)]|nr:two-component system, OmpR family, alkaline phosphatase synthesis response regulator PhoP [Moorella sp. (in: firmicutes)]MDK2894953.1 two-component system, OmpR family, alkaline phosphatase synthesis response regulator PhoP [Moorella sp. (in: firmicutes)]
MTKILVVDDEVAIQELVRYNLERSGFEVLTAPDGPTALAKVEQTLPDLIILDLMLPGIDGLEVCRRLKANKATAAIPIIILSAKNDELDKVLGLELGADDYVTKPFSPRELLARVKVCLRRLTLPDGIDQPRLQVGPFLMEVQEYRFYIANTAIKLAPKEFELMHYFLLNVGKVLRRELLLQKIWGYDYCADTRTVDVHVHHLREKIEPDPANPIYIETIRRVGYRFREIVD